MPFVKLPETPKFTKIKISCPFKKKNLSPVKSNLNIFVETGEFAVLVGV